MSKVYDAVGLVPGTVAPSTKVRRWDHALLAAAFVLALVYPLTLGLSWLLSPVPLMRFDVAFWGGLDLMLYLASATMSRRNEVGEFLSVFWVNPPEMIRVAVSVGLAMSLSLLTFFKALKPLSNTRHLKGPRLLEGEEAVEEARRKGLTKKEQADDPWCLALHPDLVLPKKQWNQHTLIFGGVGAGKTQILLPLVKQLLEKDAKTFIYDVKGDFTSKGDFGTGRQPILVSPFDKRSYVWDVGRDVRTPTQAAAFASSLIPEDQGNGKFWSIAAQQLLTGVVRSLQNEKGVNWGWQDLAERVGQGAEPMHALLKVHYPKAAPLVENAESQSTNSVLMTLAGYTKIIDDLAMAWPEVGERAFSITAWAKDGYAGRNQVIVQSGNDPTLTRAYIAAMLNVAAPLIVSPALEDNESGRCLAFILDELASIGRISLPDLIDKGRSKGVVVVAGLQDLAQLQLVYGQELARAMTSMVGMHVICRVQAGETREEVARLLGKRKVVWHNHGERARTHEETRNVLASGQLTSDLGFKKGKNMGPLGWGIRAIVNLGGDPMLLNFPGVDYPKKRRPQAAAEWTTKPAGASPPPPPTDKEKTQEVLGLTMDDLETEMERILGE